MCSPLRGMLGAGGTQKLPETGLDLKSNYPTAEVMSSYLCVRDPKAHERKNIKGVIPISTDVAVK